MTRSTSPRGHPARRHADRCGVRRLPIDAASSSRAARGRRRGEPPGADPRQPPHGRLEQVGLLVLATGTRASTRWGTPRSTGTWRRVRPDQGRPQDPRVRALPVAERRRSGEPPRAGARSRRPPSPSRTEGPDPPAVRGARPDHRGHVEDDLGVDEIVAGRTPSRTVDTVVRMIDRAEQAPPGAPGIKITPRPSAATRRMPITNRYVD